MSANNGVTDNWNVHEPKPAAVVPEDTWHFRYLLSKSSIGLLGPISLVGAYLPSTDERGYAQPHEPRLLIRVYQARQDGWRGP